MVSTKWKAVWLKGVVVLGSLCLSLGLIEIGLHLKGYHHTPFTWEWATSDSLHVLDKDFIYRLRPNYQNSEEEIYIDSRGFRSDPYPASQTDRQQVRVVVVGDSFVFGSTPTYDTYPYLLEKKLEAATKQHYEVINAGVRGYGTDQQFKLLTEEIIPNLQPTVIVWNVNVNDLGDSIDRPLYDFKRGVRQAIPARLNQVYLQGFFNNLLTWTPFKNSLTANFFLNAVGKLRLYSLSTSQADSGPWVMEKMESMFDDVKKIAEEKNIKLVFAVSPSQTYLEGLTTADSEMEAIDLIKVSIGLDVPLTDHNEAILAHARQLGAGDSSLEESEIASFSSKLDFSPYFLDESDLFFRGYWHPNRRGNEVMAEATKEIIVNYFTED